MECTPGFGGETAYETSAWNTEKKMRVNVKMNLADTDCEIGLN